MSRAGPLTEVFPPDHVFAGLARGGYGCIAVDPPWTYSVFSEKGNGRSAKRHYETMSQEAIAALPVGDLATKHCHLFLWITGPCLARGMHLPLMAAWGFTPSAMAFVWLKAKKGTTEQSDLFFILSESVFVKGMGHTTRQNAEFVILGRRGSPTRATKAMHQLIVDPRRQHSRKPAEFRDRVEQYVGPGIRIAELFSRESRKGWDCWGFEARKYDKVVA